MLRMHAAFCTGPITKYALEERLQTEFYLPNSMTKILLCLFIHAANFRHSSSAYLFFTTRLFHQY
jgi:hypothetical protein